MSEWRIEDGLKWRPLEPFGAEVDNDLGNLNGAEERFYSLLRERAIIIAHNQNLTMEQQTRLLQPVGPLILRPGETGFITTESDNMAATSELSYHADAGYTDAPFAAISLHAVDVVDDSSSTRFVSAAAAYDRLPADLKERLDGLSAEMIMPTVDAVGGLACDADEKQAVQSETLPAVRVNPRTGQRVIGVNEMQTWRLVDMDQEESRNFLHAIYDHLRSPDNFLEHRWRSGDFIVWDNLTLQHARGELSSVGRRVLQRVVAGA